MQPGCDPSFYFNNMKICFSIFTIILILHSSAISESNGYNFALIDKEGFIRSRKDAYGNPIIYYKGIVSEEEKVDDDGSKEEISALKEDIKKLLNE